MPHAFEETRFPETISYGAKGGPEYATTVNMLKNGHEMRNSNWSASRNRYEVSQAITSQAQLDTLLGFFHARKGRATGFRLKDWADYRAVGQVIGTGDANRRVFQLVKTYTSGSQTTTRSITKPVSGAVDIYVDSVLQVSGVTVDTTTGQITFDTAPADGATIAADFEFDVPVRFDTDQLHSSLDKEGLYSWGPVELVEIKV